MNFFKDAAKNFQFGFQDPATSLMEGIIDFHNHVCFFLIVVTILVGWLLFKVIRVYNSGEKNPVSRFSHSTTLEIVWTFLPAVILMAITIPSFALLYSLDESINPFLTLKIIGAQWYWQYQYSDWVFSEDDNSGLIFDSYMLSEDDLKVGQLRLLEVDNRVVLPINTHIRVLVTSQDVLHSWSLPAFGIKIDACPGRLNQASIFIKRIGTYYGNCAEICGVRHGFMPIVIEGVSLADYGKWLGEKLSLEE